eukprot:TRINITY_DN138_c0_g1_i1.p2 TRINITY_DN138_c0_g1~~TRINITY_DN138_c0_g1_i1.p2  ORF type:complete len:154 (-),score=2.52 TRINITY_DN138_c0_g1_i1:49-510(-)
MSNCAACQETIEGASAKIGDKKYHQHCLACTICKKSFVTDSIGSPYPQEDGTFQCGACRHGSCAKCGQTIDGEVTKFGGKTYHKNCYSDVRSSDVCAHCNKGIDGYTVTFEEKQFHKACYEEAAPECAKCGKKVLGSRTTLDNKNFHPECYED